MPDTTPEVPMADLTREQLDRITSGATVTTPELVDVLCAMARAKLDLAAELEKTKADYAAFVRNMLESDKRRDELADERHAIGVTPEAAAWVISKVVEAIDSGPSFRAFVYGLMGFGPESYAPLYMAGGMAFTNAIENAGVDAGVSVRRSDRRARRWEAKARDLYQRLGIAQYNSRVSGIERATARRELDEVGVALQEALQLDSEHELSTLQMVATLAQYRDDAEASADTAVEDRDAARRELGEVREAATVALAALRRYESAEGYKQDWRVDEAVAHLAAALGKEQGNG